MYDARDLEYIGPCAGGILIVLLGDYPEFGGGSRTRRRIEFDRGAVEKLVEHFERWLEETKKPAP